MDKNKKIIAIAIISLILILAIIVIIVLINKNKDYEPEQVLTFNEGVTKKETYSSLETVFYIFFNDVFMEDKNAIDKIIDNYENKIPMPILSYTFDEVYEKEMELETYYFVNMTINDDVYSYIVTIDGKNSTFKIEETTLQTVKNAGNQSYDAKYNQYEEILPNFKNSILVREEIEATYYLNNFKVALVNQMYDKAYDMLNEEYRDIRYENLDKFTENMKEYFQCILNAHVKDYAKLSNDNYLLFYDQYENGYYVDLDEKHIPKMYLDTYTIMTTDRAKEYKKQSTKYKYLYNLKIFMNMINNGDFDHAYEVLDSRFKAMNYPTVEDFKLYIRQNMPLKSYCTYEKNATVSDDENIYAFKAGAYDYDEFLAGTSPYGRYIQFIIKNNGFNDYVVSFSI